MSLLLRRRLRAPQEDGAALIDPPLAEIAALIAANQAIGREFDSRAGFPSDYRARARFGLMAAAVARVGLPVIDPRAARPLILTGHQPELFHPGVWIKNFLLSSLARQFGGTGVNLLIDNDVPKLDGIRVPTIVGSEFQVREVLFDAPGNAVVWEGRAIRDMSRFERFEDEVSAVFRPFRNAAFYRGDTLLHRLWPLVVETAKSSIPSMVASLARHEELTAADGLPLPPFAPMASLGESLADGRHELETQIGLKTGEVPMNRLTLGNELLSFLALILERHREFHEIHNRVLAEYRLTSGIRGAGRPVPDLAIRNHWYESPLWTIGIGSSRGQRYRLFVRKVAGGWEITDGAGVSFSSSAGDPNEWLALRLNRAGFCLRPRALITTMYARLVLSDLFIHGIGGAKYDEVTDEIIRRFFGIEPPKYVTATATFRLPIDRPRVTVEDVRDNAQRLRDVRYRPESFVKDRLLAAEPAVQRELAALAAEKKEYVQKHALRRGSEVTFRGLDQLNRAMHQILTPVEQHLQRERARLTEDLRIAGLLGSREFSFVLYPEEYLVPRLLELVRLPA